MARSRLAVAVSTGMAAVSLLLFSSFVLRSGASAQSVPDHSGEITAKQDDITAMALQAGKVANRKERENIANRFIHQKLQVWQERMNMPDWNIQIRLARAHNLEPNTLGNVHWDLDQKQATIQVLSTYDYKLPFQAMLDDMEVTVVHELVHIQLAQLPRSEASRGQEEHAVVQLTDALLSLSRGKSAPTVASSGPKPAAPVSDMPPATH